MSEEWNMVGENKKILVSMKSVFKENITISSAFCGCWRIWKEAAHHSLRCFLVILKTRVIRAGNVIGLKEA